MQSPVLQNVFAPGVKPVLVNEANPESFAVPIRFGTIRRERPAFPGLYRILLREQQAARSKRAWAWSGAVAEA